MLRMPPLILLIPTVNNADTCLTSELVAVAAVVDVSVVLSIVQGVVVLVN